MVSVASRYIMSASHYYPRYQSRSSMYIRGLIPRNFAELVKVVPIEHVKCSNQLMLYVPVTILNSLDPSDKNINFDLDQNCLIL